MVVPKAARGLAQMLLHSQMTDAVLQKKHQGVFR